MRTGTASPVVSTPEQFKAWGDPMRHGLLFFLGQGEATFSQLAAPLGSNKGTFARCLDLPLLDELG